MEKTLFAGITVLDPGESILADDGAFTGKDRRIIDRLLELGAKTHRHTGLPGLSNPVSPMGASAVASGGQIPAGIAFSVGYTLEDESAGETLLAPLTTTATANGITTPTAAPAASMDYTGGTLLTDTYYYAYSYLDGEGGETPIGPATTVEREPGYPTARAQLSGLNIGLASAGAAAWNLYRAVGGGDFHLLASGTANNYTDDGVASVNCDITPLDEIVNTTNNNNSLIVRLPSADALVAEAETIDVYLSQDGTFVGDVLLDQFPVSSAGATVVYRSLDLLDQSPPSVNTSVGGASKIDPDEELLDWHWKRPVESEDDLPDDAEEDDVRVVRDEGMLYWYTDGAWEPLVGGVGGGGGGSGTVQDVTDGTTTATNVESIRFIEGSGVSITVAEVSDQARVTISASGGGGGGGGGSLTIQDQDSNEYAAVETIYFSGGSNMSVDGSEINPGEISLVVTSPIDHNANLTAWSATGVTASGMADITPTSQDLMGVDGVGAMILSVETNVPARVRLYASDADRDADAARPIGTDPTGDHGLQLEYITTPGDLAARLNPPVQWWSSDGSQDWCFNVTNLSGSTEDVLLTIRAAMNIVNNNG